MKVWDWRVALKHSKSFVKLALIVMAPIFAMGCQNKNLEVGNASDPMLPTVSPTQSLPYTALPSGATALTTTTHGYKVEASMGTFTKNAIVKTTGGYTLQNPTISQ